MKQYDKRLPGTLEILVPTYSKVPPIIQAMRRTPFGNFVSFPAEMLRTTFNNLNISMREAASSNPELRAMGT